MLNIKFFESSIRRHRYLNNDNTKWNEISDSEICKRMCWGSPKEASDFEQIKKQETPACVSILPDPDYQGKGCRWKEL